MPKVNSSNIEDVYVWGTGPKGAKVAIVGEQPAKYEAQNGECFTGPAGQNLNECLREAKIRRNEIYLTNVIKNCGYDISKYIKITSSRLGERAKPTEMWNYAVQQLKEELEEINPNVIVPVGNSALWAVANRAKITLWRGSVIESTLIPGKKVIPTVHPATYTADKLFINPSMYLNRYLIILDLKKVARECEFPQIELTERNLVIKPSIYEALDFIQACIEAAKLGDIVNYDIETTPGSMELGCISLSFSPNYSMSIPFVDSKGDYFSVEDEFRIMRKLSELLGNPAYKKGGQNIGFDSHFLLRKYGIRTRNMAHDTMIAQGILYPDFVGDENSPGSGFKGRSLAFITAFWTDIPYYKAAGKEWIHGISDWEKGWKYNAIDSVVCSDAGPKQLKEIAERDMEETLARQMKLIPPLTYMMEHGVRVNMQGIRDEYTKCLNEEGELTQELHKLVGFELNPDSPKQVAEYFYNTKKMKPFLKDGKPTTNEDAMNYLAGKGLQEARMILRIRRAGKRAKTFCSPSKVDSDGRMRCSYNPAGSKFGRLSSTRNIFGTGINMTNVPHSVLTHFLIDEGYVGYSFDMSQIENRIVAYVGNIPQMIETYERNEDSHTKTAALIFHHGDISKVNTTPGSSPLGDGTHDERFWGKKANHGFNYGFGPQNFSVLYDVPLDQAKWIHSAYHRAYPGLEKGYWAHVQESLKRTRTLTNLLGRKVLFLGKWEQNFLNAAYSCIPQGSNADHIGERGLSYIYYDESGLMKPVELLMIVHDSIEFQIPLSIPLTKHAEILIAIKKSLEIPLRWRNHEFAVPADLTVNFCLNKELGAEIKGNKFSMDAEILADSLRSTINKLKGVAA